MPSRFVGSGPPLQFGERHGLSSANCMQLNHITMDTRELPDCGNGCR